MAKTHLDELIPAPLWPGKIKLQTRDELVNITDMVSEKSGDEVTLSFTCWRESTREPRIIQIYGRNTALVSFFLAITTELIGDHCTAVLKRILHYRAFKKFKKKWR